ncbi:MAG: hypothetical protein M3Q34_02460 [bacterium]|nr:hypothetical protein [bacterium]
MIKRFKMFSKLVSAVTVLAMLSTIIGPSFAMAASVTSFSILLSREKAATLANQTITFTVPTGIASGETMILTYDNSTSVAATLDFEDVDLKDDGTDLPLAASPSGATWGVVRTSSTVITFTNGTTAVVSGSVMEIQVGTHATFGVTGVEQITNGSAGLTTLSLTGTMGTPDITGSASMSIIDDDQVSVTATVNSSITFDLDTATTDTNSSTPYSVSFGTLTTSAVARSGASINSIWADLDTNASGGAAITVLSTNASLKSTSTPADTIASATATMAAGTANYGLCVASATAGSGTLTAASPFNGATCADGAVNTVGVLTTSAQNIATTSAPIATGRLQIRANAAISGVTKAHTDYTDTLTFIATATF